MRESFSLLFLSLSLSLLLLFLSHSCFSLSYFSPIKICCLPKSFPKLLFIPVTTKLNL